MKLFDQFLVAIHLLAAVGWIGGIFFATFVLLRVIKNSESPVEHRPFLKRVVGRFRGLALLFSGLLFITGILMIPMRSFRSPIRFTAITVMILGWVVLTAVVSGTIPSTSYSSREEDIMKKEAEEWNVHRMFYLHIAISLMGMLILVAGSVLTHTGG